MRVRLIVTGDLEKLALAGSLERILREAGADVTFDRPLFLAGGALTTSPLCDPQDPTTRTPSTVKRMAHALVTETIQGATGKPADLVVGIDDLELANRHQPEVVIAWIRRAVREELTRRWGATPSDDSNRMRAALRTRCSFHLLVPLVEAYFFGEPAALHRAGVAADQPVQWIRADVEQFETDDPTFLPRAQAKNREQRCRGYPWWHEECHPKHYLEFLLEQSGGLYDETIGGKRALATLDWPQVGQDPTTVAFARALFQDLADGLSLPNPLGDGLIRPETYPTRTTQRDRLLLRNL